MTSSASQSITTEWRIEINGWIPVSLNKLMGNHWGKAARIKKRDAATILNACQIHRVYPVGLTYAEKKDRREYNVAGRLPSDPEPRKRHVSLEIRLGKGERAPDPDNLWKSTLDGLKNAGMLFDDNRNWCSHDANIVFTRGVDRDDRMTTIVLREES